MQKLNLENFEKVFIYKCLTDNNYFTSIVDSTNVEYIADADKQIVYDLIKRYHDKRGTIPTLTELKNYLTTPRQVNSFKKVLLELQTVDKKFNEQELLDNTERYLKERAVFTTIMDVSEKMRIGDLDTSWMLDQFEKHCNINLTTNIGLDLINRVDLVVDDLKKVEPVIPSKWSWLDDKLDGGFLQNGRGLYIFAGQTNVGKSIVLGNIAKNIAEQNKTVLLLTFEMSELVYAKRICSNITKIPIRSLKTETESLKQLIKETKEQKPGCRIIIKEFPPSTVTPKQLTAFIKTLVSKGIKIDAIVLDYLNLLHTNFGANSYERVKHITEQVRAMTYIFNCPCVSATQLNKTGMDVGEPSIASISESYGLGSTADFIASVFQNEEDAEHGMIRFGILKNRFGPNFGTNVFGIDYNTLSIIEDQSLAAMIDDTDETRNALMELAD